MGQVAASPALVQAVTASLRAHSVHGGAIYTTAALLAEGAAELEAWHQQGFVAVDMETATTFAVAEYFGMARVGLLVVFDNPRRGEHLLLSVAEQATRRQQAQTVMWAVVLGLAREWASKEGSR